ncbi:MAG: hypothetical protein J2P50_07965 [Hyphomicrobiaceae bacterium]|nr:hypothetical protein [Hyphomicrobiaceae bacterium]
MAASDRLGRSSGSRLLMPRWGLLQLNAGAGAAARLCATAAAPAGIEYGSRGTREGTIEALGAGRLTTAAARKDRRHRPQTARARVAMRHGGGRKRRSTGGVGLG